MAQSSQSDAQTTVSHSPNDYLAETNYLNYSHPKIQQAILNATQNAITDREKAIAIHDFVRERILFGFSKPFYAMRASEVLEAGKGFCNNQSTIFTAMLRGAKIPARHRFFSLSAKILDGIIDPGTSYVDHAIVEVFLGGKWIPVDSYIVDSAYAKSVQAKLKSAMGLGMRSNASLEWDGINPSYSQFHPDFIEKTFGVYEDVGDFYDQADNPNNKFGLIERLLFPLSINSANKKIQALRSDIL